MKDFSGEYRINAVRSSGKGGQHVNKVSTKVELVFNVAYSLLLSLEEKELLTRRLKLSNEGEFRISCQESRSQLHNKETVIRKFNDVITKALLQHKKRVATKPTKSSQIKRTDDKKHKALIKKLRQKDF